MATKNWFSLVSNGSLTLGKTDSGQGTCARQQRRNPDVEFRGQSALCGNPSFLYDGKWHPNYVIGVQQKLIKKGEKTNEYHQENGPVRICHWP